MKRLPNILTLLRRLGAAASCRKRAGGAAGQRGGRSFRRCLRGHSAAAVGLDRRSGDARAFAMLRMRALRHTRLNRLILWLGMPLIVRCFRAAVSACLLASAAAVQDARFIRSHETA